MNRGMIHYTFGPVVKKAVRICEECGNKIRPHHKYTRWGNKPNVHYKHRDCNHPDEYPRQSREGPHGL